MGIITVLPSGGLFVCRVYKTCRNEKELWVMVSTSRLQFQHQFEEDVNLSFPQPERTKRMGESAWKLKKVSDCE